MTHNSPRRWLRLPDPGRLQRTTLRLASWGLALFALWMLFLFGGLVVQGYRMEEQAALLQAEISALEQDQRDLQGRRGYVQSDAAVDRLARERLDMAHPEDVVLQLQLATPSPAALPAANQPAAPPAADPAAPPAAPNWRRWWDAIFGS